MVHFTWSGSCMVLHWCKDMLLLSVVWQNLHPIKHNIKVYLLLIYTYMYHTNKKKSYVHTCKSYIFELAALEFLAQLQRTSYPGFIVLFFL